MLRVAGKYWLILTDRNLKSLASKIFRSAIVHNLEICPVAILILFIEGKYVVQSWRYFPDLNVLRLEKNPFLIMRSY